ncbi:uncharacterized protein [Ptychodera flava]|uniref:uncharacterized protein n=1 Tax=Ptychodera flava TaxID=63121 RepID=UPI00396A031D
MEQMEKKGDTRRGKIRECQRFRYEFDGYEICEKAWRFIHDISVWSYKSLKAHYKVNGIAPREHGLKGKKAHNAFSFEIIQHVVQFIMEYSNEFGLPMPAVPRGREGTPPVYLPSSITKDRVYSAYVESCEQTQPPLTHVGLTTFKNVWKDCVPHIQTISPKTDVCVKCEEFRNKIMFASSEDDKLLFTSQYNEHVMKAQKRREFYKNCVQKSFEEYESLPQQNKILGIHTPCSQDLFSVHYSFDYAQHFSLPHQSRQVGPLYFLSPMKVFCFGVCNEVCKEQINYLFTEADSIGQDGKKSAGPNNVISILHHHLSDHSLGEKQCSFHADNCGGQNKNKSVLHYMSWRTSTGLHDEIQIHFMEPGHTKCICDACFGKVRQLYRRSDVDTVDQLATLVNKSANINKSHVLQQDSESDHTWQWYQWDTYLSAYLKPLKGIRKYHHFRFNKDNPGKVYVKEVHDEIETEIALVRNCVAWPPPQGSFPEKLECGGLSDARHRQLHDTIQQHVRPPFRADFCTVCM